MERAGRADRKNREAKVRPLVEHSPARGNKGFRMNFRIQGLRRDAFAHLIDQAPDVLRRSGAERITVASSPGYPDRITLDDVPEGQTVLLLNHLHQPADSPFRASHAIYAREHMIDADIADGTQLPVLIERMLANPQARYLHAHYAKWGCYAARVDRVSA